MTVEADEIESCARCGSSLAWWPCSWCESCGYSSDDPDPSCGRCNGDGWMPTCASSPSYCRSNPLPGRAHVNRHTPESDLVRAAVTAEISDHFRAVDHQCPDPNHRWFDRAGNCLDPGCTRTVWSSPCEACSPHPNRIVVHVITRDGLMDMLRRAHAGEDPEMIYIEEYANSDAASDEDGDR